VSELYLSTPPYFTYLHTTHQTRDRFALEYRELNLDKLDTWLRSGRLDATKLITMKHLRDSGCINKNIKTGVMLLGGVRALI